MATPQEALAKLQAGPGHFLESYWVKTTRANGVSGPTNFYFGARSSGQLDPQGNKLPSRTPRPGSILGTLHMHDSKNFLFVPPAHQGNIAGPSQHLLVWHVDVTPRAGLPNLQSIPPLRVSKAAGPDIMVTTSLNGCTFCCETVGNDVFMAHIQPTNTGALLATEFNNGGARNGGQFVGGNGNLTYFGSDGTNLGYDAGQNNVTVIGVRLANTWRVFAQKQSPINVGNQVTGVVEFFVG